MSEAQYEKLKREQACIRYMDTRTKEEVFPDIEKIEIIYHLHHGSAFGNQERDWTWNVNMQSQIDFVIECLNRECTSIGFDLKNEIYDMYKERKTEKTGTKHCDGQEAPDHPEQRCDGTIKYMIKISYKL